MIDATSSKAQTASVKNKERVNTAMVDVKQQRDVLGTELAALETPAGEKLDKTKAAFTERVDRIKVSLKDIEKSL